jgi:hypothetical protein
MSHRVFSHKAVGANNQLTISSDCDAMGLPDFYTITWYEPELGTRTCEIKFNDKPLGGWPNGVTEEVLLAVVADRLIKRFESVRRLEMASAANHIDQALSLLKMLLKNDAEKALREDNDAA